MEGIDERRRREKGVRGRGGGGGVNLLDINVVVRVAGYEKCLLYFFFIYLSFE